MIVVEKSNTANATSVVGVVDVLYVVCEKPQEELLDGEKCGGFDTNTTTILPGQYLAVVTLGAYEMVKVDASGGTIQPGDLLATSSTAGLATKVTQLTLNDVSFYAPGTIIGKALSGLDKGVGFVAIFVSAR